MITRDRKYLGKGGEGAAELLRGAVEEFESGLPRLERLWRYRQGRGDIMARERAEGLNNARIAHGFARYITQVSAGYLLSEPVRYSDERRPQGVRALEALYKRAGAQQADTELVMQQAGFGRGVSLFYEGEGGLCLSALDPRSAFVVYDDTVEHRPLMGVLLSQERDARGRPAGGTVTAYLPGRTLHFRRRGGEMSEAGEAESPFERVPMVEYRNNEEERCDFEEVLGLIDAYDLLCSDRMNDRMQFADALLVLTGVAGIGTTEDIYDFRGGLRRLREDKTLSLPDSDARAEWLVKNPVEKDIDVLRRALAEDIHKFSMTPDFSDERFAGNVSGVMRSQWQADIWEHRGRIGPEAATMLCLVFRESGDQERPMSHVGLSLGDGRVVDARSHHRGVVVGPISAYPWTHYAALPPFPREEAMRAGDRGEGVKDLQELLLRAGYALPRYGADGAFGGETLAAVKRARQDLGLPEGEEADGELLLALRSGPEPAPDDKAEKPDIEERVSRLETALEGLLRRLEGAA